MDSPGAQRAWPRRRRPCALGRPNLISQPSKDADRLLRNVSDQRRELLPPPPLPAARHSFLPIGMMVGATFTYHELQEVLEAGPHPGPAHGKVQ